MIKFFTKRMNNRKGFTLIELIVVIAILGILVAIAVPRIAGFRGKAQKSACEADARTVLTALTVRYEENSGYTFTDDDEDDLKDLEELTGKLKGTVSAVSFGAGAVNFTYANDTYTITITDGGFPDGGATPVSSP